AGALAPSAGRDFIASVFPSGDFAAEATRAAALDFRVPALGPCGPAFGTFLRSVRSRSTAASRAVTTNHATTLLPSWLRLRLSLQRRTNTSWRISSAASRDGRICAISP